HAAEVADTRHRDRDQAIEELVHARAAQRHLCADRQTVAHLEGGDRLAGLRDQRLLAGDLGEIGHRVVHDLLVRDRFADTHVDRDLGDARHLHHVLQGERLLQLGHDFVLVEDSEARGLHGSLRLLRLRSLLDLFALRSLVALRGLLGLRCFRSLLRLGFVSVRHIHLPQASTTSLLDLKKRTLRPSASVRNPTRSPFFVTGFHSATFERSMAASFSTMPPCTWRCGFGFVWRLIMFTPSTTTWPSSSTLTTVPRRPLSRPAVTTTSSPLRIFFITAFSAFSSQSTSGASEMIFMNCAVRSSRVTGPKMRVPIGSSLFVSSTAALPSKRISEPSGRRTPNLVRTTTAS